MPPVDVQRRPARPHDSRGAKHSKNEKGAKIKNINKEILENFYKLAHPNLNVRLTAARSTFKILQVALRKSNSEEQQRIGNENLNYCVQRLVAGLSSSRDSARNGYGVLLLEILESIPISLERILLWADQKIGNITKDSARDTLIGWYLLITIILKSGKLNSPNDGETNGARANYQKVAKTGRNEDILRRIFSHLMAIMKAKSYMEIPVAKVLRDYLPILALQMEASLPRSLLESDTQTTPIDLFMALLCQRHGCKVPQLEVLDLNSVASIMKVSACQGNQLHPLAIELTEFVLREHHEEFPVFAERAINPTFFVQNHNELANNGLNLISSILRENGQIVGDDVKYLLTTHVVRLLVVSLRDKKVKAQEWFDSMIVFFTSVTQMEADNNYKRVFDVQYAVIDALTSPPGSIALDVDSRSSVLHQLITASNSYVLLKYMNKIRTLLTIEQQVGIGTKKRPISQQNCLACISQLGYILKRPQMVEETDKLLRTTIFLGVHAYFKVNESVKLSTGLKFLRPEFDYDDEARCAFKQAYHTVLEHIISGAFLGPPHATKVSGQQRSRLEAKVESLEILLSHLESVMNSVSAGKFEFVSSNQESILESWSHFIKRYQQIKKQGKTDLSQTDKRKLLIITMVYQYFGLVSIFEELEDVAQQLDDLRMCLKKALSPSNADTSPKVKIKAKSSDENENEAVWADVLADLMLSILSIENCDRLTRRFVEVVYSDLVPHITRTSLEQLRDAIIGTNDDDEDDEDDDDDDEDNDEESESSSTCAENEMEVDCANEHNDHEDQEGKNENLNNKQDEEEDDEQYMDDDQMLRLDSALAEIVKSRMAQIANGDECSSNIGFRLRALELIRIAHRRFKKESIDTKEFKEILWPELIKLSHSGAKVDRPMVEKVNTILKDVKFAADAASPNK